MRIRDCRLALVVATALVSGACATSEEWALWSQHPAHFASAEHIEISLRNRDGKTPHVSRQDIDEARSQQRWGEPATVRQAQTLDRLHGFLSLSCSLARSAPS